MIHDQMIEELANDMSNKTIFEPVGLGKTEDLIKLGIDLKRK